MRAHHRKGPFHSHQYQVGERGKDSFRKLVTGRQELNGDCDREKEEEEE